MLKLPQSMIAPFVVCVIVIVLPDSLMLAVPFTTDPLLGRLCPNTVAGIAIAPTSASASRCRRTVRSRFWVCFVRIVSPLVEGRVVRGFEGLDVGDTLRVKLRSVDVDQRFIDFERG